MLKLLSKREVDEAKTREDKRKIDEGIKIARKVDSLRELHADTESSYHSYRTNALSQIQSEIDAKIVEREELESGNKVLRVERNRLETPVDLTDAWNEVQEAQESIDRVRDDQDARSEILAKREEKLAATEESISVRQERINTNENETNRLLLKAAQDSKAAQDAKDDAERSRIAAFHDKQQQDDLLASREGLIKSRESDLAAQEERNRKDKEDNSRERRFLADQRKTLERALARLKTNHNA